MYTCIPTRQMRIIYPTFFLCPLEEYKIFYTTKKINLCLKISDKLGITLWVSRIMHIRTASYQGFLRDYLGDFIEIFKKIKIILLY